QTTSKEFIEYLRDNNHTDSAGQDIYDAWAANGRSTPVAMAQTSLTLDLSDAGEGGVPHVTSLAQNYPNPFNPRTWVDYSLAKAGPVSLKIYDARGRLVRTLVEQNQGAGPQRAQWDGLDDGGRGVASGVYHYVLQTEQGDLRRKMTLLR
ncbi:hypothetical protein DRQ50_02615, partial [bacterium]